MAVLPQGETRQTQHTEKDKRRNPSRVKQERKSEDESTTQEKHRGFPRHSINYSAVHITNSIFYRHLIILTFIDECNGGSASAHLDLKQKA